MNWPPPGYTDGNVPWGLDANQHVLIRECTWLNNVGWVETGRVAYAAVAT